MENISIYSILFITHFELFYNNGIMICDISYSGDWEQAQYSNGNYGKKTTEILAGFPKNRTNCVPGEIRILPGQLVNKENNFGENRMSGSSN